MDLVRTGYISVDSPLSSPAILDENLDVNKKDKKKDEREPTSMLFMAACAK